MTETGAVRVDHHQFLLAAADADTTDTTAEGRLIWTGPGFVTVLTGIAYGPATLTLDRTDRVPRLEDWDTVEETVIDTGTPLRVMSLDGEPSTGFTAVPAGRYRIRVHARGRDGHWDLEVAEPTETYLVTVTATGDPVATLTTLRKTDTAYDPPAKQVPVIDYDHVYATGSDGQPIKVGANSPEAHALYARRNQWGGRPPTGRIGTDADLRDSAAAVADLDRDLVDEIDALSAQRQRELVRWCARCAFERAGLTEHADFRDALDAIDSGRTPPPDLVNLSLAWHRLDTDPRIVLNIIPGPDGEPERIAQHKAITAYTFAIEDLDPTRAAFEAVRHTAATYGRHYRELIQRLRTEFLQSSSQ